MRFPPATLRRGVGSAAACESGARRFLGALVPQAPLFAREALTALVPVAVLLGAMFYPLFPAGAAVPLSPTPDWSSNDSDYATGGALFDIDGDGDLDLVTGNGNDMQQETNAVYYNLTGWSLETTASWHSADAGYHAHVAVGDVDGDGDPDVAVARYGNPYPYTPQRDRIYYNLGGVLETTPSWTNDELDNTFSVAFGDVDGDGDLDLAAACGESYTFRAQRVKLYLNSGGVFSTSADWLSDVLGYAYDVAWGDVDGDGDLDLAVGNEEGPNHVYYNLGTALETTPSWISADTMNTLQVDWGDIDQDGDLDLAVADNNQLGNRESRVRVYLNLGGVLETTPSWNSTIEKDNYSCVRWADVDYDGDPDLAAGGWWEPVEVYENLGGALEGTASWSWGPIFSQNLVCEQLCWGDVDQGELIDFQEHYDGDGARRLYYVSHRPLHSLNEVRVGGTPLTPGEYCCDPEAGWISLAAPPPAGPGTLEIRYTYSASLDLVVTNWHENQPNHLFLNTLDLPTEVAGLAGPAPDGTPFGLRASPNPLGGPTMLRFDLPETREVEIALYSAGGRRVRVLARGSMSGGTHEIRWNADDENGRPVAPGIYLARASAGGLSETVKLLVLR